MVHPQGLSSPPGRALITSGSSHKLVTFGQMSLTSVDGISVGVLLSRTWNMIDDDSNDTFRNCALHDEGVHSDCMHYPVASINVIKFILNFAQ